MIEFQNVSKIWPDGTAALLDVSLVVPKGQFCVLLGPSGAGKSTLLRAVNGLTTLSAGQVLIDGIELTPASAPRLRRRVGMIHQHCNLASRMSVAMNTLCGVLPDLPAWRSLLRWFPAADRERACELLARVGLDAKHLFRRAGDLSGGQQQRVGIARAFMLDPDVILADEPVASLDPRISHDIMSLIREVAKQRERSILCSLHQVNHAREFADRIVALRDGRVVFDDVPAVFTDAIAKRLYGPAGPMTNAASNPLHVPVEHDPTATHANSVLKLAA